MTAPPGHRLNTLAFAALLGSLLVLVLSCLRRDDRPLLAEPVPVEAGVVLAVGACRLAAALDPRIPIEACELLGDLSPVAERVLATSQPAIVAVVESPETSVDRIVSDRPRRKRFAVTLVPPSDSSGQVRFLVVPILPPAASAAGSAPPVPTLQAPAPAHSSG